MKMMNHKRYKVCETEYIWRLVWFPASACKCLLLPVPFRMSILCPQEFRPSFAATVCPLFGAPSPLLYLRHLSVVRAVFLTDVIQLSTVFLVPHHIMSFICVDVCSELLMLYHLIMLLFSALTSYFAACKSKNAR